MIAEPELPDRIDRRLLCGIFAVMAEQKSTGGPLNRFFELTEDMARLKAHVAFLEHRQCLVAIDVRLENYQGGKVPIYVTAKGWSWYRCFCGDFAQS